MALGRRLDLDRAQVTRALLTLLQAGYEERRGKRPQYEWRLTPNSGRRGKVPSLHAQPAAEKAEREPPLPPGPMIQRSQNQYYGKSE